MAQFFDDIKFKQITKALSFCFKNDQSNYLMGVNWAHVIRYHPEYLKHYLVLYKKKIFFLYIYFLDL